MENGNLWWKVHDVCLSETYVQRYVPVITSKFLITHFSQTMLAHSAQRDTSTKLLSHTLHSPTFKEAAQLTFISHRAVRVKNGFVKLSSALLLNKDYPFKSTHF